MIAHEHVSEAYAVLGGSCEWGWCAEPAVEGFAQRFPQPDGAVVTALTPYCAKHGALNREVVAYASRRAEGGGVG